MLDIDGWVAGVEFLAMHGREEELDDRGETDEPLDYERGDMDEDPEFRRRELVVEIVAAHEAGLI